MNAREYEEYLASFDQDFVAAEPPARVGGNVPDGKYQVKVDAVEIRTNQNNGRMELAFRLKVMTGEHTGRIIFHQREIDNPERMSYLRGDLQTCGLDITKLSELPRRLNQLLDVLLDVQVRSKPNPKDPSKTFTNVYLNRRIDAIVGDDEDDKPF